MIVRYRKTNRIREIKFEGYSMEEILEMPVEEINKYIFIGEPLVFLIGSAQVLGEFRIRGEMIVVELAKLREGERVFSNPFGCSLSNMH